MTEFNCGIGRAWMGWDEIGGRVKWYRSNWMEHSISNPLPRRVGGFFDHPKSWNLCYVTVYKFITVLYKILFNYFIDIKT